MENYGGKANSLIKLRENNFNVPNFFIIDSSKFKEFLNFNNLSDKLKKLSDKKDFKKLKELIVNGTIPANLKKKIIDEFDKLDSKFVSVRSSASNEDGLDKSFAGQYETYLNVSIKDLFDKIKLCWCSLYSENVFLYSKEVNLFGMNIVIQEMVEAQFAGVAFSIDPTSDTKNYSIIELVDGLGEKLVSGKKTPSKFIVRRETSHVDLKINNILVNEKLIERLEHILLSIESLYGVPVDVEFAILKDEIYILQARPITAMTPLPKTFSLTISRPNSLIEEEIYFKGEYIGIKDVTRNLYYFKPLFIYNATNRNTEIYYNQIDLEEDPTMMYYYMDLDYEILLEKYEQVKRYVERLKDIIKENKKIDIDFFIDALIHIFPFASLGQLAGHFKNVPKRVKNILFDFRNNYDYIIHKSCDYLLDNFKNSLPDDYKEYANFISLKEYETDNLPPLDVLQKRQNGYIFYDGKIIIEDHERWFKENNILIKQDDEVNLKGYVSFGGNVEGKVCKVFGEKDFEKFERGNILVTPMTTPKFIKVIELASGIITDEGGTTCHAAIYL